MENFAVTCAPAGTDGNNQACGTSASDLCVAGDVCVSASTTVGQCLKFCSSDSNCSAQGGICVVTLDDGTNTGSSIPGVTLCSPGCHPIGGSGCPSGSGCELGRESAGLQRWFGLCGPVGGGTQGQACTQTPNTCANGFTCIDPGTGLECLRYCDVNSFTGCSGLETCYGLQDSNSLPIVLNGTTIGVCF